MHEQKRALALLSGGLDSTLATRIMLDQGFDVEAVHFTTPFCNCDKCAVDKVGDEFNVKIHHVFLGQEFLDLLMDPPHGYGSQMNICIDCRILMFKKAKELAERVEAEYFVTGEVLDQRPFSQRFRSMAVIEREAGVDGRVIRPLSARLLPASEPERSGLIDCEHLYSIRGRRRLSQMNLADEFGINDYPCPSGGCLLTDPHFARRLRAYIRHERKLTVEDMFLLKIGRHFRVNGARVIVGRNERENHLLLLAAKRSGLSTMSVLKYVGPVTLFEGNDEYVIQKSAAITVRYSDAPKGCPIMVSIKTDEASDIVAKAISDEELETFRIL